jgi:hypothetical protein
MHPDIFRFTPLFCLLIAAGCGGKSEGPVTYPVTGVVTLGGTPVENAAVQFTPTSPDLGIAGAQASTKSDGTFDVKIELNMGQTSKPGLPAGEYRVTVTKFEAVPGQITLSKPPQNTLPPKYAAVESTPLTTTVKADGENHFEFPLQ